MVPELLYHEYGVNSLDILWERIKFAVKFFGISDIGTILDRDAVYFQKFCFGGIVGAMKESPLLRKIAKSIFGLQDCSKPISILMTYFRLVFQSVRRFDPNLRDPDDFDGIVHAFRFVYKSSPLCDIKSGMDLVFSSKREELPIFRFAGLDLDVTEEPHFQSFRERIQWDERTSEINESLRNEVNDIVSEHSDPVAKIEWMKKKIADKRDFLTGKAGKLGGDLKRLENGIDVLAGKLKKVCEGSTSAVGAVKEASESIKKMEEWQKKIERRIEDMREMLRGEQRNTQVLVFLAVFLAVASLLFYIK
jgi:hypothetical protein